MNNGLETRYFLSALTGAGYYALHRQFLRPPERYFCILKGGPGCGKSTFLKRVGDAGRAAGLAVVRLHCAGDPASLDGVYFPEKRSGFFDGTAPHTVDPALFGASGEYLDLGTFCRTEALDTARALLQRPEASYCVTPNAEMAYEALHDESFRAILNGASLVLPDGAGVVLGAKILKTPLKEKVAGIDFAANLLGVLEETGGRLYLLDGKPGIAEQAAENMKKTHPKLCICGTADGYFRDEAPVIEKINAARPDVLFVCLGAPKQECFMHDHRAELNVRLMIGLGGSLDGFAGTVRRAPKWMIRLQLEWLYRLLREPSRIGRMMRLPKFVFAAWRARGKKE
mgnify:CR=1 FL=1